MKLHTAADASQTSPRVVEVLEKLILVAGKLTSRRLRIVGGVCVLLSLTFILFHASLTTRLPIAKFALSTHENSRPVNDWSRYAYVQYVTNTAYLCNSVMLFEQLHRLGSSADRLMMYPNTFDLAHNTTEAALLRKAATEYKVKLVPIEVKSRTGGAGSGELSLQHPLLP